MRLEVFLPDPAHFLQPRIVGAALPVAPIAWKCDSSSGHSGPNPFAPSRSAGADAVIGEAGLPLFRDQPGVLEQAEVARHARLRQPEDAGQFRDVQPLAAQQPQQPQPHLVAEQPEHRGRRMHIY